jgi:putative hemolysin
VGCLTDEGVTEALLVEIDEQTMQVDGLMRTDEVNEQLRMDLPEGDDYETVAGFILYHLRRITREGEQFHCGDLQITVQDMKGPKIEKVLVSEQ